MKVIFIVDDSDVNLTKAKRVLDGHYHARTMASAGKMFMLLEKITPDLILLDIEMPEMDGFSALKKLKGNENTAKIPVMFLTASTDDDIEAKGFEMGAVDFVSKPFSASVLLNRIAHHVHIDELIKKRTKHIVRLQNSTLSVLADMVESRDKITGGHIERTSRYLRILIDAMLDKGIYADEIKAWDADMLVSSARLHDVGKIAVTDLILNKPDKLTPEEMEKMRTHVLEGEQIIDRIIIKMKEDEDETENKESFLTHAKLFAGYHHERWDGGGYARGMKGLEIPLQGRIMAVADVYDALISERPYKPPFTRERAEQIIQDDAGKAFDPVIAAVFAESKDAFAAAAESLQP
jgi:putative two-component system response regulator